MRNGGRSVDDGDDDIVFVPPLVLRRRRVRWQWLFYSQSYPCSRDVPEEGSGIALTRLEERRGGLVASTEACQVDSLLAFLLQ